MMQKILCLTANFLPQTGGMQMSTHQTILGLVDAGAHITLIADPYDGDAVFDKSVPYKVIRSKHASYLGALEKLLVARRLYKSDAFDVVLFMGHHFEVLYPFLSFLLPFSPIILAAGTRLHYPNSKIKMGIRNFFLRKSYQKAKKIIVISEATKNMLKHYCIRLPPIKKIYRPVDEAIWSKSKSKNKMFTIATIARLTKTKNIPEVLYVLHGLIQQGINNWQYLIFGEGEDLESLMGITRSLNLQDKVVFMGNKKPIELVEHLRKVDLFVLLSKSESFGRVYVEAAALGIPSIAYETLGTRESIKNGYSGYVFPQGDKDAVENTILKLMDDKMLLDRLSQQAKTFYESSFTKKKVACNILNFIACRE